MKIKDLIEMLQTFNPETELVLTGCEGGVYNPSRAVAVKIVKDVNKEWYYGPHEIVYEDEQSEYPLNSIGDAVLIV